VKSGKESGKGAEKGTQLISQVRHAFIDRDPDDGILALVRG
jgi:hypothetical protein